MFLSPIRYILARNWPLKGYVAFWGIIGEVLVFSECQPSVAMLKDWTFCLLFIASIFLAPAFFIFLSLPISWFILGPIYYIGDRLAGAPFHNGDQVQILAGPHRNQVVEIYEVWESRRQVRVYLDAGSKKSVTDVFSFTQVCRQRT